MIYWRTDAQMSPLTTFCFFIILNKYIPCCCGSEQKYTTGDVKICLEHHWNTQLHLMCYFFRFYQILTPLVNWHINKALICQWTGLYELVLRPMRCFSFCFPCREMQITPCGGLILFSLCTQCFNKFENAKMMRYMYITCVKLIVTVELTFAPSLSNTLLSLTYEHKPNICQKKIQQLSWVKKI